MFQRFQSIANSSQGKKNKSLVFPYWNPPPLGYVKLNSDGAMAGNPGIPGSGGFVRDDLGRWILGFMRKVGWTTSVKAEMA